MDFWIGVTAFYFQFIDMNQAQYLPEAYEKCVLILVWYVIHVYLAENYMLLNQSDTNFFLEYVKS